MKTTLILIQWPVFLSAIYYSYLAGFVGWRIFGLTMLNTAIFNFIKYLNAQKLKSKVTNDKSINRKNKETS